MNASGSPKRRSWTQFSLRAMFVLTTLIAIWLGIVFGNARKLRRAIDAVTAAGGAIYFRHQHKDLKSPPPGPAWLRQLVGDEPFLTPERVVLRGPNVTDEFLGEHLDAFRSVEDLDIESPNLTDAGLVHLRSLTDLHFLGLGCPLLTDAGIAHIADRAELYSVTLDCPCLTDAALAHVATLPKLSGLVINSPHLTPSGLRQLAVLEHLEFVRSYRDPGNVRIVKSINIPADVDFNGVPLRDVLAYLKDYYADDLPANLDDVPETKLGVPITICTKSSLNLVLDAILEQGELGYYFDSGRMKIAPRDIAEERRAGFYTLRSMLPPNGKIETDW